ncbi:MAG: choice-of-anchor B family protein [Ignavibacteria bacterium]
MRNLFITLTYLFTSTISLAQLPNYNTYLLKQLDDYAGYSALWGYTSLSGGEYALLGCDTGTSFVNITDSANIYEVDFVRGVFSQWREIKTYSHYAYVVSEGANSRLQIIDLQYLPDSVSLVTTWTKGGLSTCHAISQSGPYLYLSGNNASFGQGVQIVDVTDPVNPVRRGGNNARYVHDTRVRNDTLWACNIFNSRLTLINATDKDNLQEIRTLNSIQQGPHSGAITNDRKYIFITHETDAPGTLDIWNIEDLTNMTYVKSWQPAGISTSVVHNIEIYDSFAYVAHYTAGIRIINISDPQNPVEAAWYDTRPQDNGSSFLGCWTVYKFASGKIIASDVTNGLFVIKATIATSLKGNISEIKSFDLFQNYPNPFNPETQIRYILNENGTVKLSVYDNTGRLVSLVFDGFKSAGSHKLKFNSADLTSGIYFYRLDFNGMVKTLKMVVLK